MGGASVEAGGEWREEPGNGFRYACPCGAAVPVSAAMAGSSLGCRCGRDVKVPSLSRLRASVGRDDYESGIVDEIKRLVRSGALPSSRVCALSKRPTEDVATASLVLPRFFKNQERDDWKIVLIAGWVALLLINVFRKPVFEDEGTQTIEIPIRVAASQQAKARGLSQNRLRKLLRAEPSYARLLQENPHARITILGSSPEKPGEERPR